MEVDGTDVCGVETVWCEHNGRTLHCWLDLADGRTLLWTYVLGIEPGLQGPPRAASGTTRGTDD